MGEFWAAIAGAVVGGAIAFFVQMAALREARKQRREESVAKQQTLAYALIFKLIRINSHLRQFNLRVDDGTTAAKAAGHDLKPWQIVGSLVNLPAPVHFTTDEIVMLRGLTSDPALFAQLAEMDERHSATVAIMEAYSKHRHDLTTSLGGAARGKLTVPELTPEQQRLLEPRVLALDNLLQSLIAQSRLQEQQSFDLLQKLNVLVVDKLGLVSHIGRKTDDQMRAERPIATE